MNAADDLMTAVVMMILLNAEQKDRQDADDAFTSRA